MLIHQLYLSLKQISSFTVKNNKNCQVMHLLTSHIAPASPNLANKFDLLLMVLEINIFCSDLWTVSNALCVTIDIVQHWIKQNPKTYFLGS